MEKSLMKTKLSAMILLPLFLFQFRHASARNEPSDDMIGNRLRTIQQMLERGKPNADRWWVGWLAGYGAATAAQVAVGVTSGDKESRQDMVLGAATTFLGAMGQIVSPMAPSSAPERFDRIPEGTPAERADKLGKAEKLLKECASREREGRSWKTHAITGAVNLGSGLVVWLGFKRSVWEGLGNFALNTAITEIQIFTQPTRAIKDYDEYVREYESGQKPESFKPEKAWFVSVFPGGLGIRVVF